ncbi:class I SAM-dependent methyltransferase [Geodermatophilus sp. SYSU D00804]
MPQTLGDGVRLLRAFVTNPRQVGAVLPTSRTAVRAMLDLADVPAAGLVVELGAGTGVATREILARLGAGARLVALEIDPQLARRLSERLDDPRLQVVCGSAEDLDGLLDGERADVVVSMLPFTSLEAGLRRRLLDQLPRALRPGGTAVVIQYSPLVLGELRRRFADVRTRVTPWNVPPAFLFACTGARDRSGGDETPAPRGSHRA